MLTSIDDIEREKRKILLKISGAVQKQHGKLRRGETDCKGTNPEACSTLLFGALSKAVTAAANAFVECSPEGARSTVLEFQTPTCAEAGTFSNRHPCTLKKLFQPEMDGIWRSLHGMRVEDYPFHKPHLAYAHAAHREDCS